jgi:hypothetical protein
MKRVLAMVVGAGMAVGGGAAAWAGTAGAGGPNREAVKACRDQAREELPDADRATLREAVKACLIEAGIEVPTPTPEQRARREAVRGCIEAAKDANPEDKAAARAAARDCLADAGVTPGRLGARMTQVRECLAEVRGDHPAATRAELRDLVKECVHDR